MITFGYIYKAYCNVMKHSECIVFSRLEFILAPFSIKSAY